MRVLVTGAAGFIGYHLCINLIKNGIDVIGYDNFNQYYDVTLKNKRSQLLNEYANKMGKKFYLLKADLRDFETLCSFLNSHPVSHIVNLAAQAGVRYSLENPMAYIDSNIAGFLNVLEVARSLNIEHLIYASSSSVYGGNTNMPFSESDPVDHPLSLYAATKRSNELMAHSYSHLFGIPTTGLRFFTVYGPWGRPDMALFLFTKSILQNSRISVYNYGKMERDFTYVDDIVESILRLLPKPPAPCVKDDLITPNPSASWAPFRIFNIGNGQPVSLLRYLRAIENELGMTACIDLLPIQPGDVPATASDSSALSQWISFTPSTSIEHGVKNFVAWYKGYYK